MKRTLLLTILILTLGCINKVDAQFSAGLLGGMNYSDLKLDGETDNSFLWGAGFVLQYQLSENFSLVAEPMYVRKGAGIQPDNNTPRLDASLSFIETPVMLKYEFGESQKLYLLAGPVFGYLLTSKLEAKVNTFTLKADTKHITEKLEIGLTTGGGFSVPVSFGTIFLEGRYTYGFTNLAKTGTFTASAGPVSTQGALDENESKYQTIGIQVLIGAAIPL